MFSVFFFASGQMKLTITATCCIIILLKICMWTNHAIMKEWINDKDSLTLLLSRCNMTYTGFICTNPAETHTHPATWYHLARTMQIGNMSWTLIIKLRWDIALELFKYFSCFIMLCYLFANANFKQGPVCYVWDDTIQISVIFII